MCILFIYLGKGDDDNDYSLILASNRDEFYDRLTENLGPWTEDPNVFGGRDLKSDDHGTWLAVSLLKKRFGALLNLPGNPKPNSQSRGRIVADYVKHTKTTREYIKSIKDYTKDMNQFILVTVEFDPLKYPIVQSYNNVSDKLEVWKDTCIGFGNCLPETPLKKIESGKIKLHDICSRFKKIDLKQQLIIELLQLLKSEERHLPDPLLERTRPNNFNELSSIFVCIPEKRYGTRTHTILLVTKNGHIDLIEETLQHQTELFNPKWVRTEYQFDVGIARE